MGVGVEEGDFVSSEVSEKEFMGSWGIITMIAPAKRKASVTARTGAINSLVSKPVEPYLQSIIVGTDVYLMLFLRMNVLIFRTRSVHSS